jgi:hypothetical protein
MSLETDIQAAAERADFGEPSARKGGRNPKWPHVPLVVTTEDTGRQHEQQLKGVAFQTRQEAIDHARKHIENARKNLAKQLADPRMRALREQHGLPREIT